MNTIHHPAVLGYRDRLDQPAPDWLSRQRRAAAEKLASEGLPAQGDEAWKYTSPRALFSTVFAAPEARDVDLSDRWYVRGDLDRLVFVDGRLDARWSKLPAGARSLQDVPVDGPRFADVDGIAAWNLATATDGAWLELTGGAVVLAHVSTDGATLVSLRHRIEVAGSASVQVVFEGRGTGLTSVVTEIVVGRDGSLTYAEVQEEHAESRHLHRIDVRVGRDARMSATLAAVGASVARTEIGTHLEQGASVDLAGLTLGRGSQILDFHTTTRHAEPHATSRQLFKAILDGKARGVYTGRVIVPKDAVGSDVGQSNPTLLLSDGAIANARPQLEISCDEVKASHGAAIGRLDPEAQFYLQARGLGAREARALLTFAFAGEVVERLPEGPLRSRLDESVRSWLEGE